MTTPERAKKSSVIAYETPADSGTKPIRVMRGQLSSGIKVLSARAGIKDSAGGVTYKSDGLTLTLKQWREVLPVLTELVEKELGPLPTPQPIEKTKPTTPGGNEVAEKRADF